jgi:hypothetical protein
LTSGVEDTQSVRATWKYVHVTRDKEAQRTELHRTIWRIATDLRGSVDGWDFKSYVLGIRSLTTPS